jgi:hypothetical protein
LSDGHLTRPKSGQVRSVPMDPEVATALARLGQRGRWTGDDDLVFPGISGDHVDASRSGGASSPASKTFTVSLIPTIARDRRAVAPSRDRPGHGCGLLAGP